MDKNQKTELTDYQKYLVLGIWFLGLFFVQSSLLATENFFILWGPISHVDKTTCVHRPQDPYFPLPNQLSYIAYFEENPDIIITEQSPKWNIRDDATIPGNGYYGVEVGNLHEALPEHSNVLVVKITCYGTHEQAEERITLRDLKFGHQQHDIKLGINTFPNYPSKLEVKREENKNIVRWSNSSQNTYDLYRCSLVDTLLDGRPMRVYYQIATSLETNIFIDESIDPSQQYGYLVISEDKQGRRSGHSPEVVDLPTKAGPIARIAPFTDGRVAVAYALDRKIQILDEEGGNIAVIETEDVPVFSVDTRDRLWVLHPEKTKQSEVKIYTSSGKRIKTVKWPKPFSLEKGVVDLDIDRNNQLWLLTQNSLIIFDRKLHQKSTIDFSGVVSHPTSISILHNKIAIADPVRQQIKLYRFKRRNIEDDGFVDIGNLEPWGVQWFDKDKLVISDPFKKVVSIYNIYGEMVDSYKADVVGSFESPRTLSRRRGDLYVADEERVVILPMRLRAMRLEPTIMFDAPGKATISWRSEIPTRTAVRYWVEGGTEKVEAIRGLKRTHKITLTDLPPIYRINYSVASPLRVIPPIRWTKPFDFATPIWESGKTAILRLPLAVILHTHAVDLDQQPKDHPSTVPISSDDVERIRKEINDAVLFYWNNSRMKVFLDVDFFTNNEFLDVAPFGEHPHPDPERIETFLSPKGHHVSDYVGILRIIAEQRYDEEKGKWVLAGRGGGFTWGINPIDKLPGASWWRATPYYEGSGNDWLFTHEFHHQLDAMFQESDHPEYPFNHFSPMEYSGPFGEHFDGNAYILREWPKSDWFLLKWGERLVVDDLDEDGIPDDTPFLPSDERRLGSNPEKKDTDGDGLSDLEEILLSNWIAHGVGEDWGSPINLPKLTDPDSDGDGLIDKKDPFPLYNLEPKIHRNSPTIDGIINEDEWSSPYQLKDGQGSGDFFLSWDEEFLYGATIIQPSAPFHLQIDANVDGWFDGRDNLIFRFTPNLKADESEVEAKVFVCDEQPERYPYIDPELFPVERIRVQSRPIDDGWSLEFAIPKSDTLGLNLVTDERIGINAGYYFDQSLRRRVSLFEPHKIIILTLEE